MVKFTAQVMAELQNYANPKAKLSRLLKTGTLVPLRRGLYADSAETSHRVIAAALYGPSYISFQYALSLCGFIPERVAVVTCASFRKNKNKVYRTPLGEYRYYCLPPEVYPYGITQETEEGAGYLIASAEKALCDLIYRTPSINSLAAMEDLLFLDWRMNEEDILALDTDFITQIAPLYRRKTLDTLLRWFKRRKS
jgi:predicted transcriptional regulator of viral defense system